ncbi:MAG: hypothetical protein QMD23_04435, partial [Candidatus Bathyarchaeia archaeon]|nr:hypothetical protein [Candidatus Bathyarchaeia archaeon]
HIFTYFFGLVARDSFQHAYTKPLVARGRFELLFLSLRQTASLFASKAIVDVWEGKKGYVPKLSLSKKFAENLNRVLNLFSGATLLSSSFDDRLLIRKGRA